MAYIEYFVDDEKQSARLSEDETTIGRSNSCMLKLTHDDQASRLHCSIKHLREDTKDEYFVKDEGARNGTFLNGEQLGQRPTRLKDHDQITVGNTVLTFRSAPQPGKTMAIFGEVAGQIEKGEGFHSLMDKILKKKE